MIAWRDLRSRRSLVDSDVTRSARLPAFHAASFHVVSVAAIAAVCIAIYSGTFGAGWVLDDWDDIVQNPSDRWTELSPAWLWRTVAETTDRRPVAHVSFGINHYFGGTDVTGYHAVNLLVHAINGVLVYLLALRVFGRLRELPDQRARLAAADVGPAALVAALLFVAHPLQIQAVTYVVQRMTSLATAFYLGALLLALRASETRRAGARRGLWAAAVACAGLALGSKEIAFTLPAAWWLIGWCFAGDLRLAWLRRRAWQIGVYAGAAAVVVGLAWTSAGWDRLDFGPWERLLTQARVALLYASLVVWPLPSRLNLLHEIDVSHSLLDPPTTLASVALLAAAAFFVVRQARPQRLLFFGAAWFALHMAIESGPVPLRMIFEHRLYLPLVGVAILVSGSLFAALGARRVVALGVSALLVALLSAATWARNETWRDTRALWRDTAAKSPGDWLARMQLGSVLAREGRLDAALEEIDRAIALAPEAHRPRDLKGAVLLALGRPQDALASQLEAIRLAPGDPSPRMNAARVLVSLGRLDEAAEQLEAALAISADEDAVYQLARVRERQGRIEEALALQERVLRIDPRHRAAMADAGGLLARLGRHQEAVERLSAALESPGDAREDAEWLRVLASSLWALGRPAEAIAALERGEALDPGSVPLANDLAWMLATCPDPTLRDPARALATVEATLRMTGRADAGLLDTWAASQAAVGDFERAVELAGRAVEAARADGDAAQAARIEGRLALYRRGEPWVEAP